MTPDELNNAAATAVLGWFPNQSCVVLSHSWFVSPYTEPCELGTVRCKVLHRAPDMSSPENVVKMIEWLLKQSLSVCISPRWVIIRNLHGDNQAEGIMGNAGFTAALIAACAELGGAR